MEFSNALLCDFYQLKMMQSFFKLNKHNEVCVFDYFYRKNPFGGAYSVFAGITQVINYLQNLHFSDSDIEFLRKNGSFDEEFLNHLKNFKFSGDVYSMQEGSIVFPKEIILRVHARREEAIFIESALLLFLNHESLIATKARRIRSVCGDDFLSELGLRRAQGESASIYGARASIIGGFNASSNVLACAKFKIPCIGTMSHSWVLSFSDEYEAFKAYSVTNEQNLIFLIDTYDTLNQGIKNAIKVFKELRQSKKLPKIYGVRLDSGDLAYLSKEVRIILDNNGFNDALIFASNDLDENIILDLKNQDAKINAWGVGTKVITADGNSSFGGVYKLAGIFENDKFIPKMKFSNNIEKITAPGIKNTFRLIDKNSQKIIGDLVGFDDEKIDENSDFEFFSPQFPWKSMTLKAGSFRAEKLLKPIMKNGEFIGKNQTLEETCDFANSQISLLWSEFLRLVNPPESKVDFSKRLYEMQTNMMIENSKNNGI